MSKIKDLLFGTSAIVINGELSTTLEKMSAQEHLIDHAINLIALTCAKTNIDVYRSRKNKVEREYDDVYYQLNVRPNLNESSSSFWYRVFYKLLKERVAMVISLKDQLHLVESFEASAAILNKKVYSKIVIADQNGNGLQLNQTFSSDDVFLFDLGNHETVRLIESFYKQYDKAIQASFTYFVKNNSKKYTLTTPAQVPRMLNNEGKQMNSSEYAEALTNKLGSDSTEVIQLPQNFELEELEIKSKKDPEFVKTIKDFGNLVANTFGIPIDVFWGTKTEKSQGTDDFITFACSYPIMVVEDGLNASIVTKEEYLKGDRVKFNTHTLKYRSPLDIASNIDKLRAIGYSYNDIQEMLNEPRIDEKWANERYITKNYMNVLGEEVIK